MQYFRPGGPYFAGDCMPFWHEGVFHLIYLLDENHHQALNGLGGHQWAHATTTDLIHWEHHPLLLGITEEFEGSICTGSVFCHAGKFYAFYATRRLDRTQHLSLATSEDGIHFTKVAPNPLVLPGQGYSPVHFRDPNVFQDPNTGLFHLLVTAKLEPYALTGYGGCLAHLTSSDLHQWQPQKPFLIPGFTDPPECPDLFCWNGWYYLICSNSLIARYRMARHPLGPWITPPMDVLDGRLARVMKTAAFGNNRRIGVAWLGTRMDDLDNGRLQWGGHLLFRELIQHADGTLGSKFPAEMTLPVGPPLPLALQALTEGVTGDSQRMDLAAPAGLAVGMLGGVARNVHLTLQLIPQTAVGNFGLRLRGHDHFAGGYDLRFYPIERRVTLHEESIEAVDGLDRPFTVEINLKEDIIDVCIDQRRCLVNRCPERQGDRLFFFGQNSTVTVRNLEVCAITA